ncbi:rho GTPase-activating protein 7 [Anopheles stephensi]|uniref:rho GTPase-activating protein 7 n=1 Tax=Anopheles stephensi TaxID=30069 RepID=UPI0016589659|nr:rho GTPase-activating protein 7 [Anopheles stephensi]XP_035911467.1 rho GTPase-activating protein 7 [Anopheles stephensi]XP_035911468.1 rho GTPase-activating protein 7 [Anopheles stephensi]XP_035911469.1 rho GTPase-activating protein 7 [Anopheles stephensi]XP_035911470.1 rho GTPase-activating protein 7 [Anopheles stephensi]
MIGKCIMTSLSSDSRSPGNGASSSSGGDVANNNHLPQDVPAPDIVLCRTKMRDRSAVGNGHVAAADRASPCAQDDDPSLHRNTSRQASEQHQGMVEGMCRLATLRTASARSQMASPTPSGAMMSNAQSASAVIGSCDPARSVESSVSAAAGTSSNRRHHQSAVVDRDGTRDMTDSGSPLRMAVSSTVVELEDSYAELERILEKVQAEISEMFEQTMLNENGTTPVAGNGTTGSDKKRKNDLQANHDEGTGYGRLTEAGPPLQTHHQQQQNASHHVKYATIPHANVTQQSSSADVAGAFASNFGRNNPSVPIDSNAKRTRNAYDHRYRSHDRMEMVSSTTSASTSATLPKPSARSQSAGETMSSSGYSSYGRYTERSDSLSDDMSLLDVAAPSCEDSQEGAGDDTTSDERETIVSGGVRKRHQQKQSAVLSSGATAGPSSKDFTRYYYNNIDQQMVANDRGLKTSTNSLPSVAATGGHRNMALHLKFKSHQSAIDAKRKQFFLTLDQEPFQPLKSNMADLPSPSSTSLHSGHNHLIAEELGSKSSSAPVLLKDEENVLTVARANLRYSRSQSDRHLAEIEAIEACRWLRAAGFPQYAQMYEDHQFPIIVEDVAKDHPFLEPDPLQSLFRRLHTLNRCANMHLDAHQHTPKPSHRDDSDDDSCALSEAWTFQHNSRRWSRVDDAIGLVSVINNKQQQRNAQKDAQSKGTGGDPAGHGSHQQRRHNNNTLLRAEDHEKLWLESGGKITIGVPSDTDSQDDCGTVGGSGGVHLRRTGSERLKDGAKAILRRVESIKSRRRKKQNRDGLIILAPPAAHSSAHLSPHHRPSGDGIDGYGGSGFDIMSYSNPTSPRPSAELLAFDDALDAAGNRKKDLFANDLLGRRNLLLSPNVSTPATAWSPLHGGTDGKRFPDRSSPGGTLPFRQQVQLQQESRSGDDSSSICSEDSGGGGGPGTDFTSTNVSAGRSEKLTSRKYPRAKKALRSKVITSTVADDQSGGGALSDSECHAKQRRSKIKVELLDCDLSGANDGVSTTTADSKGRGNGGGGNTLTAPDVNASPSKLHRGGSLNLGKASKRYRDAFSNRSVRHSTKATDESGEGGGRSSSKRSPVARWHSFQQPKVSPIDLQQSDQLVAKEDRKPALLQRGTTIAQLVTSSTHTNAMTITSTNSSTGNAASVTGKAQKHTAVALVEGSQHSSGAATGDRGSDASGSGVRMSEMSCGQLLVVRKLGLANLTGYMERYCPTHRSGWNWDLPKFIKRIKTPDYKDRKVFGMPLVLNLQKYGSTVPYTIRLAFGWLEKNALDQVGLFRKPGVKSRIAKLKSVIEASNDVGWRSEMFDEYHAYDVADLVKQYFRELPDPLLTAKLSETFIAIFQYLPDEVRAEAVQSAILLLPDEHREVLHLLLTFLEKVVQNSSLNQMTANNLAVCFAPSLFYLLSGNRYTAASPRRKKTGAGSGTPDEKELSEAKASHECLAYMIDRFQSLWTISSDQMRRCNFNYMDESKPVPLASLGTEMHVQNWRGYLSESINECLREGRERPRGWVSLSSTDPAVTAFFKKVGDGHPLRLWKCVTEVEAPPMEVIQHIVNERPLWDAYLLKWRTIEQLDQDTDVFQYACGQPVTEYCVVRQWKNDLPRGACVIVEVSISHESATSLLGGVNGVVLASRYLIEPCGSGKCKLMHLSRVDMKGRTPDWYNKNYGHVCQQYLSKIKKFFEHCAEGPETKV